MMTMIKEISLSFCGGMSCMGLLIVLLIGYSMLRVRAESEEAAAKLYDWEEKSGLFMDKK
jgi:hypothetical protein